MDAASLNFNIDSSSADKAKQSLDQLVISSQNAAKAAAELNAQQAAQIQQLQQMVIMQAQASQGHSSMASTIAPLAGALAVGAGSFAAATFAMNGFTDLITNGVSRAIDSLNQRLTTTFTLMGALNGGQSFGPGGMQQMFNAATLNQNITGITPLSSLQNQFTATTLGLNPQVGNNFAQVMSQPTMQEQILLNQLGLSPNANQQQIVNALLAQRASPVRTQEFASFGMNSNDINSAFIRQQVLNAQTPAEALQTQNTINNSNLGLSLSNNANNIEYQAQQDAIRYRQMPSLANIRNLRYEQWLNGQVGGSFGRTIGGWYGRTFGDADSYREDVLPSINQNINSEDTRRRNQGLVGFQDLLNKLPWGAGGSTQSIGTDLEQIGLGISSPITGLFERTSANLGLGTTSGYYNQNTPGRPIPPPNQKDLDDSMQKFSASLQAITPDSDQIAGIRQAQEFAGVFFNKDQSGPQSENTFLNGRAATTSTPQIFGMNQILGSMPQGGDVLQMLTSAITDFNNRSKNPLTYDTLNRDTEAMSISQAPNVVVGGRLQAEYGALQQMGINSPTQADLQAQANNPWFNALMQGYNQQPQQIQGQQIQNANASLAQTLVLSQIPVNDSTTYDAVNQAMNTPNSNAYNAVNGSYGLKNYSPNFTGGKPLLSDIQSYLQQQSIAQGIDPKLSTAIATMEGAGKDNPMQLTGGLLTSQNSGSGNWQQNINDGLKYLKQLETTYGTTDPAVIAAAYNAGPNNDNVNKFVQTRDIKDLNNSINENYVDGVVAMTNGNIPPTLQSLTSDPGVKESITAENAKTTLQYQRQAQQSNIQNSYTQIGSGVLATGRLGSGITDQQLISYGNIQANVPDAAQAIAVNTANSQIDTQTAARVAALQGQGVISSTQAAIMQGAYGNTNLPTSLYNQRVLEAQGRAQAVGISPWLQNQGQFNSLQDIYTQEAKNQSLNQLMGTIPGQMTQVDVNNAVIGAGSNNFAQQMAAYKTQLTDSGLFNNGANSTQYNQLTSQQAATLISQAQRNLNTQTNNQTNQNQLLTAQANINPFLSPTQQAMQLGQAQIYQQASDMGLSTQSPAVQQAVQANNAGITDQQQAQRQQQVSSDIQDMSDTVVTSLEKLATGGYNAAYLLKSAVSNITGEAANALVFQPLQNAIAGGIGDIGSVLSGGSASTITGGGLFGSLINNAFGVGSNAKQGASVSSGGSSWLSGALGAIGSVIGLAGGAASQQETAYQASGLMNSDASLVAHQGLARGGIISQGGLMPFARGGIIMPFADGDVFTQPTNFPMSGGMTGLMGEAGPEAIVPLTRGADGKLGVASVGGGSSQQGPTLTIHAPISVSGGQNGKLTAAQQADMQAQMVATLHAAVKSVIVNEQRNGGTLSKYGRGS